MARTLLTIQSHVVYGHVGNSAAVFPLQRLGCEVWPIHTVQFSSHAGYPGWRGRVFDAALIDECVAGLQAIGALARCDGVISGYLGKAEIGEAALARLRRASRKANPRAAYSCDPVIGDEGRGVYVDAGVAEFLRERAVPAATALTPNAFELSWLARRPVGNLDEVRAALARFRARGPQVVLVTSLTARRHARRRARHDRLRRRRTLAAAHAETADRRQRRGRSRRRAVLLSLAALGLGGASARRRRFERLRNRRRDFGGGRARIGDHSRAGRNRAADAAFPAGAMLAGRARGVLDYWAEFGK